MLQRKIEKFLQTWKQVPKHNPLVVKGCRHCGKTTSILDFAKKEYAHVVYLNFQEKPDYAAIFRDSVDVNYLVMLITALPDRPDPGRSPGMPRSPQCPEGL